MLRTSALTIVAAILAAPPAPAAHAASPEFAAAIGRNGFGRCHMDACGFFVIDASVPVGSSKDGTLFAVSAKWWEAEYRRHGDDDDHEYDRPPVSVGAKTSGITLVFCSKTKPMLFDFSDGKWQATRLRPGDEHAVFGYSESGYTFYYAACHQFITKDPVAKAMALRLGYTFANRPAKDGDDPPISDENAKPLDALK